MYELLPHHWDQALVRRENFFSEEARPLEKASLAISAIFLVVGLTLVPLAIFAIVRARGHRLPYIVLLFAVLFYLLYHPLDVVYYVLLYDPIRTIKTLNGVALASTFWAWWTDVFYLAAIFLILGNRQASLKSTHPNAGDGGGVIKKLLDFALVGLLALIALVRSSLLGAAYNDNYDRTITRATFRRRISTSNDLAYFAVVIYFFIVLDIAVTAFIQRSRISRVSGASDSPTNTIGFAVLPVVFIHWVYRVFLVFWAGATWNDIINPSTNAVLAVDFVSNLEAGLIVAIILSILLVMALKHQSWNTFGDQSVGQSKPQWGTYPVQQYQNPYMQQPQQMQQPYVQNAYGYQGYQPYPQQPQQLPVPVHSPSPAPAAAPAAATGGPEV